MLTATGIIGKIIEFVLTKLAGKQFDLALDEKKRAAQAFIALFESILGLERVTTKLLRHIEPVVDGKMTGLWMPSGWTLELADEIDRVSAEFLQHAERLAYSVSLMDPALGVMLGYVQNFKVNVLGILSIPIEQLTFSIVLKQAQFREFKFTLPAADVNEESLASLYSKAQQFVESSFEHQVEWPRGSGRSLFGDLLQKSVGDRAEDVCELSKLLSGHLTELQKAREQLRAFIAKSFKIEDLVFVSDRRER